MGTKRCRKLDGSIDGADPSAGGNGGTVSATSAARSSLTEFKAWMIKAGITWDESLIHLRAGLGGGDGPSHNLGAPQPSPADAPWAVYAVSHVPEGHVLASLPRHAVLSAPNSGLADVLAAERLGGGLALVAAVMYEAARGRNSKWYGYLSSLPHREYLPVFWSGEQLQQLEGTDLADKAHADRKAMTADFESELAPLIRRYPARLGPLEHGWNLEAFMRAASWVASRAFYVDEHHGDALVPLADVFNHKAARVDLGGCGGGWAEGFEVAEHADARYHQQQRQRGALAAEGASRKRRRGKAAAARENAAGDGTEEEDGDGEDDEEGLSSEQGGGAEGSSSPGEGADDDEDEVASGDEDRGSGDGDSSDSGDGGRRGRGKPSRADLDREPGDDGDDPWPPPPPPPRRPLATAARRRADAAAGYADAGGGGSAASGAATSRAAPGGGCFGRWGLLADLAVSRGGRNLHLDIGICAGERGDCEVLDIVAAQPLEAGAEVFNTYGEHGNGELVNKYGFALPYNPFDEICLDKRAVLAAVEAVVGCKAVQKRVKFLEEHSELLSEDEEPFLLLPPRHVNTALYVALWVLAAGESQQAGWASLEGALAPLRAAWQLVRQRQRQQQQLQVTAPLREVQASEDAADGAEAAEDAAPSKGAKRERGGDLAGAGANASAATIAAEAAKEGQGPERRIKGAASDDVEEGSDRDDDSDGDGDDLPEDVEILGPGSVNAGPEPNSGFGFPSELESGPAKKKRRRQAAAARGSNSGGSRDGDNGTAAAAGGSAVALWTDAMRSLLRRVVSERLAAYPTTLEQDDRELRDLRNQEERETEPQTRPGSKAGGASGKSSSSDKDKDTAKGKSSSSDKDKDTAKGKGKTKAKGRAKRKGAAGGDGSSGGDGGRTSSQEAGAARSCALLLRLGEKRLLQDVLACLS